MHEAGHNFGGAHQSTYDGYGLKIAEYSGQTDELHGPIMGSYGQYVTKWTLGHPSGSASTLQDDVALIAGKIQQYAPTGYTGDGYAPDDFAGTTRNRPWA